MAVARITAKRAWLRRCARAVEQAGESKRLVRELHRAMDRPGLTAEFQAPEVRMLARMWPDDPLVKQAVEDLRVAEAYDAYRNERVAAVQRRVRARQEDLGTA